MALETELVKWRNREEKCASDVSGVQVDLCSTMMQGIRMGHVLIYQIKCHLYQCCLKEICCERQMQTTCEISNFPGATLTK